jgi:predicted MFS family arabinose efflux permease
MRYLLRLPTYPLLIVASALGYYFFAGARGFAMIYLTQHYGVSRAVLSALALIVGIGAIIGVLLGAKIAGWLLKRGFLDARITVAGVALFISILFFGPAIWTRNVYLGVALLTFAALAFAAVNPPLDAARLDIIQSRLWGRAESGRMALRATLEGGAPLLYVDMAWRRR